ncbi:MAG: BatD family protein [Prevotellaceae bacterium]|jgi:hypothetical protein|nr:BatD family protein [Prevotellaceae bacterium]
MLKIKSLNIKSLAATLLLLMLCTVAWAQNLTLEVQAPRVVNTGEIFRVTFVANQKVGEFTPPSTEGFTVLAGPAQSSQTSVSIVNGSVNRTITISYTYTMMVEQEGTFTLGPAKIKADGKEAQSRSMSIECVKSNDAGQAKQNSGSGGNKAVTGGSNAGSGDLFISIDVAKKEVYRGEAFAISLRLYNRNANLVSVDRPILPALDGFWSQELESATKFNPQRENVNGTVYEVALLLRQLLIPQQTGELTIPPVDLNTVVRVKSATRDPFENFFGGSFQDFNRSLKSKPVKIRVKELPAGAPASFTGGVGNFKVESQVSRNQLVANDALNFTIKISGTGNLKLINAPKVDFPPDFEVYDTKITENIKNGVDGFSGTRQFEIPLVPRSAGEFTIPSLEFTYFSPATGKYVTLRTKEQTVTVEKDSRANQAYTSTGDGRRESIKFLGKDIRYIKIGAASYESDSMFAGSALFYLLYVLLLAAFTAAYFLTRKYQKESQNVVLVKNKKAKKVAKKRLSAAALLLKMGNTQGFYDELLRAMWGYLSDKLSIPVADLSQDNAKQAFAERGIEEEYISTFLGVINECEFARYAPGSDSKEMQHVYTDAANVISKLEQRIK